MTALAFHEGATGKLLLAGEGSYLKVFDAKTSNLLTHCEIFDGQAIHGIVIKTEVNQDEQALQAVIWGGQRLTLLSKKVFDRLLRADVGSLVSASTAISDWILDVAITGHDSTSCILITAHNTVIEARLSRDAQEAILKELPSPSKSILYSAHLIWDTRTRILVAAGTVFGEIIVWDYSVSEEGGFGQSKVLFTFTGHEGSIFGVNISPCVVTPGGNSTRLLASCSDDRTIRIWDLSESTATISTELDILNLPRETGFGENGENTTSQERCVATIMGHASRIWRVKILVHNLIGYRSSIVNVLSFGEDSTAQQWALEFDKTFNSSSVKGTDAQTDTHSKYQGTLRQVNTFAFHSGKHIWSTDLLPPDQPATNYTLATGGADGKISLYSVEPTGNNTTLDEGNEINYTSLQSEWDLADVYNSLSSDAPASTSDIPHIPTDLSQEDVPSAVGEPVKKKKPKKAPNDAFNRYAFASEDQFVTTTTFGRVLLGQIGTTLKWNELSLPETGKEDLKSYSVVESFPTIGLVYLAGSNGKMFAWREGSLNIQEAGSTDSKVADMFQIDSRTGEFYLLVTTLSARTATLFSVDETSPRLQSEILFELPDRFVVTSAGMSNGLFILGSRNGTLAVYDRANLTAPLSVWNNAKCTSGDAITTITSLPSTRDDSKTYFLTTGRNGQYSIFTTLPNHQIQAIHHGTPPFGPNIESAWFTTPNNHLILSGFRSKNFIVWNETLQQELTNVECGGAHRSYAYSPQGHFVYTKASKLYLHCQPSASHKIIKQGGHGREIKACAVSPNGKLFATGAEDTAIRILRYTDSFECLSVTQKHTAGIQHLQFHNSSYLFSSGGNEELFIWALTPVPSFGIGVVCEASCPDQSAEKDLRIMAFDISELPRSGTGLLISLAYSDSTVRIYAYSKLGGFELRAKGRYTAACLTQIKHLEVEDGKTRFLTAATDGYLTLWEGVFGTQEMNVLSNKRVHQNAVKCLDVSALPSGKETLVATGGDDNALAFTLFSRTSESKTFRLGSAHAAAITGLTFVPGTEDRVLSVVSSGNDQRVKEWCLKVEGGEVGIEKKGDVFTSIADVGDVAFLGGSRKEKKVLVVGNGMEVWDVGI